MVSLQEKQRSSSNLSGMSALAATAETFKIIIIGEVCVGKSSIFARVQKGSFDPFTKGTMNAHFASKIVEYEDADGSQQMVRLQFWDTAGNDRFRTMTKTYFKGARGAIVVYDVTSKQSIVKSK